VKMTPKRSRAPTSPLELANRKTDEQFIADYLQPRSVCTCLTMFGFSSDKKEEMKRSSGERTRIARAFCRLADRLCS
jgi:hypothetical protein